MQTSSGTSRNKKGLQINQRDGRSPEDPVNDDEKLVSDYALGTKPGNSLC
jgi:hypothetical protein